MELVFKWDPHKDSVNLEKHGITFSEAASVFGAASANFRRRSSLRRRASRDHHRPLACEAAIAGVFHRVGGGSGSDHQCSTGNQEGTARLWRTHHALRRRPSDPTDCGGSTASITPKPSRTALPTACVRDPLRSCL